MLAPAAWAGVGSGTLTVSDDGLCQGTGFSDFDTPNHWDVFQGQIIHINISPGFNICTAGLSNKLGVIAQGGAKKDSRLGNYERRREREVHHTTVHSGNWFEILFGPTNLRRRT